MYFIIGDSHTTVFSSSVVVLPPCEVVSYNQFSCYHVGPLQAYNVMDRIDLDPIKNYIISCDSLVFSFGEIDMRNIHKRVVNGDYESKIAEVVARYFAFIDSVEHRGKMVFGVVPCLKEMPFYDWFEDVPERKSHFYAPSGTLQVRNLYKSYYNSLLAEACLKRGLMYFDIFHEVLDREDLYIDDIHLSSPKVMSLIKNKLGLNEGDYFNI